MTYRRLKTHIDFFCALGFWCNKMGAYFGRFCSGGLLLFLYSISVWLKVCICFYSYFDVKVKVCYILVCEISYFVIVYFLIIFFKIIWITLFMWLKGLCYKEKYKIGLRDVYFCLRLMPKPKWMEFWFLHKNL